MTDQPYRVTWFAPDRPVEGTVYVTPAAAPGPDLTDAQANPRPELSAAEATLRHWASGASCHLTPEAVDLVLAEYARRGTAEQELRRLVADQLVAEGQADEQLEQWQARALWAEARVDGQAWKDLEAARDRLRSQVDGVVAAHALCDSAAREVVRGWRTGDWEVGFNGDEAIEALAEALAAGPSPEAPPGCPHPVARCSQCGDVVHLDERGRLIDHEAGSARCCASGTDDHERSNVALASPEAPTPPELTTADPWRLAEWNALPEECLIEGCDSDDIDHRGPVFIRGGLIRKACVGHWEGVFRVLGERVTWEKTDGSRQGPDPATTEVGGAS